MEEFLERTRALANLLGSVGSGALGAMPEPVPSTVNRMLRSVQQLVESAPPLTAEFEVLIEELHGQRLTGAGSAGRAARLTITSWRCSRSRWHRWSAGPVSGPDCASH